MTDVPQQRDIYGELTDVLDDDALLTLVATGQHSDDPAGALLTDFRASLDAAYTEPRPVSVIAPAWWRRRSAVIATSVVLGMSATSFAAAAATGNVPGSVQKAFGNIFSTDHSHPDPHAVVARRLLDEAAKGIATANRAGSIGAADRERISDVLKTAAAQIALVKDDHSELL